jgi:hypothetical protein
MKRIIASTIAITLFISGGFNIRGQNFTSSNAAQETSVTLPIKAGSVRFAIIGDSGTGGKEQQQLADVMFQYHRAFSFEFVLMLGDNLYGGESARDYAKKFENIYQKLLGAGIKFYATLGNHDNSNQRFYKQFNMDGKEYYSFKKDNARFFSLNSNYLDQRQIKWLEGELQGSGSEWKICFFHHPPYSSGKQHGSDKQLRQVLEPLFLKYGVNVIFAGHEHFYERIKPQNGIYYFISGAGGKLRPGDVRASGLTEKSFDQDLHFMLVEITGDEMHFQVISRAGKTIDSGILQRQQRKDAPVSR